MMLDEMKIDHLSSHPRHFDWVCMQTFVWGETYPGFADAPGALCLPAGSRLRAATA